VRKHTSIPVAEVYGCDPSPDNAVGGAYILQERVCTTEHFFASLPANRNLLQIIGRRLDDLWFHDDLTQEHKVTIMEQVSRFEGELFTTRFPLIGCIYRDDKTDDGFKIERFGPSVVRMLNLSIDNRGPWSSVRAFLKSYVDAERIWFSEGREDYSEQRLRAFPNEDPF
jgi:hypothetical protein